MTLAPFFFVLFFEKANLWPGGKSIARKKYRREKKSGRRSDGVSAGWGGPLGRPVDKTRLRAGRPYNGITLFLRKERVARPVLEEKNAS